MKYVFASLLEPEKNIELWYCDEPCCRAEQLHRWDGPAVSHPDGTAEWWWHGKRVTEAELRAMRGRLAVEVMRRGPPGPVIAPARAQFRPRTDRRASRDDETERG